MKKIIVFGILCIGVLSFGRDFEYHEVRDIVKPMESSLERLDQLTSEEQEAERKNMNKNIERYVDFHGDL